MKKLIITALSFASLLASPALAASPQHHARASAYSNGYSAYGARGQIVADPYAAVISNHVVGRDPDVNVRQELQRDSISDQ